jgi:ubiquinone/menaquinone biosynthesis C-methylase UbiE
VVYNKWKEMGKDVPSTSGCSDKLFDYLSPEKIVLDVGCGYGRISGLIKSKGCLAYGIDVNADAILSAKNNPELSGIDFSVQDATSTNFNDSFFDVVVSQAVLACMDKRSRTNMLDEMHRILKSKGIISISEFGIKLDDKQRYEADSLITHELGTIIVRSDDGQEMFRSHNFIEEELSVLIMESGFKIVSYESRDFITVNGHIHPGHLYICKK